MARRKSSKRSKAKTILRLPDLEQSKNAVLHSLISLVAGGRFVPKVSSLHPALLIPFSVELAA
jgi:hypothetical protein